MVMVENECVGCPDGMGCMGSSCPYMNVPHWYCDECENEFEKEDLFTSGNDDMICFDCLMELTGYKRIK